MDNSLYRRLARANLSRNRQMYLPYGIAVAIMSAMFFIIVNTVLSKGISNMNYGGTMRVMLIFGLVVMGIFTCGYMLYLNGFLIKRRRKEFGLYGILGLEKRHVGKIIFIENMLLNFAALLSGLVAGSIFGKLAFMLLLAMLKVAPGSRFDLEPMAYIVTIAYFCVIFLAATLYNQFQVRLANPIDLINGEKKGEKKLRGVVPRAILGLICVGAAYYAAIATRSAGVAIGLFWPAVVLVIIGTNLLFLAGSQVVLRAIKNNPKLYYKPKNFISVSGLIHRMRQNASGLANICILSTMVLVTVSCVCALYFGQEDILRRQNPNDYCFHYFSSNCDAGEMTDAARALALEKGVVIDELYHYEYVRSGGLNLNDGVLCAPDEAGVNLGWVNLYIITADDYTRVTGNTAKIPEGGVVLLSEADIKPLSTLELGGKSFPVGYLEAGTRFTMGKNSPDSDILFLVVADKAMAEKVSSRDTVDWYVDFEMNLSGDGEARAAFANEVGSAMYATIDAQGDEKGTYETFSIDDSRSGSYGVYGGLFFMGIFFAILFITNTVLIMYFKQVSEGYEDRARYDIMRSVGLSDAEVRGTIDRQVLIVFFLPLIVAFMHIFAATNMMTLMMNAFVMMNNTLTLTCIAVTCAIYAVLYIFAFRTTARTYYRIVK